MVFFDGMGNNYGEDGNGLMDVVRIKYSNIVKFVMFVYVLFNKVNLCMMGWYVEGVGIFCSKVGDLGKGFDGVLGMVVVSKGEVCICWMFCEFEKYVMNYMLVVSQINVVVFGFLCGVIEVCVFVCMLIE